MDPIEQLIRDSEEKSFASARKLSRKLEDSSFCQKLTREQLERITGIFSINPNSLLYCLINHGEEDLATQILDRPRLSLVADRNKALILAIYQGWVQLVRMILDRVDYTYHPTHPPFLTAVDRWIETREDSHRQILELFFRKGVNWKVKNYYAVRRLYHHHDEDLIKMLSQDESGFPVPTDVLDMLASPYLGKVEE